MEELRDWELLMVIYESHQTAVGSAEPALAGFRNVWVKPTIRVKFKHALNMSCLFLHDHRTSHVAGQAWPTAMWICLGLLHLEVLYQTKLSNLYLHT